MNKHEKAGKSTDLHKIAVFDRPQLVNGLAQPYAPFFAGVVVFRSAA